MATTALLDHGGLHAPIGFRLHLTIAIVDMTERLLHGGQRPELVAVPNNSLAVVACLPSDAGQHGSRHLDGRGVAHGRTRSTGIE